MEKAAPQAVLLRGGRVVDPASGLDRTADVLLRDGKVVGIEPGQRGDNNTKVIDCSGLVVAPGFIDLHVHLREPGQEYKEDIESGGRAAAAGGFTTVCCMPNTVPVNDCRSVTDLIVRRAREANLVRVHPVGAISKGLKGESLAEMGEMQEAGIVAVSDDGRPVMSAELMRRALEYARTFNLPVVQHAEDLTLSAGGVMNEGLPATRAGLRGQPPQAESVMVMRDLELLEWTGGRYHVAHISTAASVRAVREAKKRGLAVTCEVTPHHLTLTDESCTTYDTRCKCAPPLRSSSDRDALREGLADGTIDCIATDHAPHAVQDKDVEFSEAAFGMTGLETAFSLCIELVRDGVLTLPELIRKLTINPAKAFSLAGGKLELGGPADVAVFDPEAAWTMDASKGFSKSRNTPFDGRALRGRVRHTLVGGRLIFSSTPAGDKAQ